MNFCPNAQFGINGEYAGEIAFGSSQKDCLDSFKVLDNPLPPVDPVLAFAIEGMEMDISGSLTTIGSDTVTVIVLTATPFNIITAADFGNLYSILTEQGVSLTIMSHGNLRFAVYNGGDLPSITIRFGELTRTFNDYLIPVPRMGNNCATCNSCDGPDCNCTQYALAFATDLINPNGEYSLGTWFLSHFRTAFFYVDVSGVEVPTIAVSDA